MSAFVNSIGEKETMEVEIAFALQLLRFVHNDGFFDFFLPTLISWILMLLNIENSEHI